MSKKIRQVCKDKATPFARKILNASFCDLMSESCIGDYPFDTNPEEAAEYFIEDMRYKIKTGSGNMYFNDSSAHSILVDGGWATVEDVVNDIERIKTCCPKQWVKCFSSPKKRTKKAVTE